MGYVALNEKFLTIVTDYGKIAEPGILKRESKNQQKRYYSQSADLVHMINGRASYPKYMKLTSRGN